MADEYTAKVEALKAAGRREMADKVYSTSPSTKPVMEERRFTGSGGYEYAKLSDGSYKILKSPKSGGGQIIAKGSGAYDAIEMEDPEGILKSTPPEQIKVERKPVEYPTGGTTYTGGLPATRDYMSSMIGYDRNAAVNWFQTEGGLDSDSAERQVAAMENAYKRETNEGRRAVAAQYKKTLQELAKLGTIPASGASYEGE